MLRGFAKDSGALRAGVSDTVLGPVHGVCLRLQHCDEDRVHRELSRDRVVHEGSPGGEAFLR